LEGGGTERRLTTRKRSIVERENGVAMVALLFMCGHCYTGNQNCVMEAVAVTVKFIKKEEKVVGKRSTSREVHQRPENHFFYSFVKNNLALIPYTKVFIVIVCLG